MIPAGDDAWYVEEEPLWYCEHGKAYGICKKCEQSE